MMEQTSRSSNNAAIFNAKLQIATEEIYNFILRTCKVKTTYRNLDELLCREWMQLTKDRKGEYIRDYIGYTLFVGDYDPEKKACDLDVTHLCHILRYSPSLDFESDPAWSKYNDKLPSVGTYEIEACAIIADIRNRVQGHEKKIKSLDEIVYVNNAARLFDNILVLGYDEQKLRAKINAVVTSNGNNG